MERKINRLKNHDFFYGWMSGEQTADCPVLNTEIWLSKYEKVNFEHQDDFYCGKVYSSKIILDDEKTASAFEAHIVNDGYMKGYMKGDGKTYVNLFGFSNNYEKIMRIFDDLWEALGLEELNYKNKDETDLFYESMDLRSKTIYVRNFKGGMEKVLGKCIGEATNLLKNKVTNYQSMGTMSKIILLPGSSNPKISRGWLAGINLDMKHVEEGIMKNVLPRFKETDGSDNYRKVYLSEPTMIGDSYMKFKIVADRSEGLVQVYAIGDDMEDMRICFFDLWDSLGLGYLLHIDEGESGRKRFIKRQDNHSEDFMFDNLDFLNAIGKKHAKKQKPGSG